MSIDITHLTIKKEFAGDVAMSLLFKNKARFT